MHSYDFRKRLEIYLVAGLILVAVLYGLFRAYPLLAGPSITIYYPKEGDTVASSTFEISGKAKRVKEISLQGKQITIDTSGYFKENLVPYFPYTIIVFHATDSYGASITKTFRVIPK